MRSPFFTATPPALGHTPVVSLLRSLQEEAPPAPRAHTTLPPPQIPRAASSKRVARSAA